MAQQVNGEDSVFDINFANSELPNLYQRYRGEFPSMSKGQVGYYGGLPRFKR